ncbi:Phosphatidylinositol-glycan biosynthesis class W protein-like protein [Entamoeba marina]
MSEYGAHMNFFFVLGFVQILVALLKIPRKYALIGSIILICLYETCLQVFDLYTFVLSDDRSNIIYANKEGLLSVFGYTALNIASTALGYYYSLSNTKQYRIKLDFYVFLVSGVMVSIYAALYSFIPPCRPLINLSYLLSTLSIGILLLCRG